MRRDAGRGLCAVRVEHHWAPDQEPVAPYVDELSTTHFWVVDGIWPEGTTSMRGCSTTATIPTRWIMSFTTALRPTVFSPGAPMPASLGKNANPTNGSPDRFQRRRPLPGVGLEERAICLCQGTSLVGSSLSHTQRTRQRLAESGCRPAQRAQQHRNPPVERVERRPIDRIGAPSCGTAQWLFDASAWSAERASSASTTSQDGTS